MTVVKVGDSIYHVNDKDLPQELSLSVKEIMDGIKKENPVVFWNDLDYRHYIFDFVIAEKGNKKVWCEMKRCNDALTMFWFHLYV